MGSCCSTPAAQTSPDVDEPVAPREAPAPIRTVEEEQHPAPEEEEEEEEERHSTPSSEDAIWSSGNMKLIPTGSRLGEGAALLFARVGGGSGEY